jgi:hypothetical protein
VNIPGARGEVKNGPLVNKAKEKLEEGIEAEE